MPSSLPVNLAERVFATHPAPLAEAVWALETASSPQGKRDCLRIAARTLLRLVTASVLAARLQRGQDQDGDTRRTRELLQGWRSRLLTDTEWLELMREILRAPMPDFPLPRLMELTQGADGARFVVALKRLLALSEEPEPSLEDGLAQFHWLLEHLDAVWADARLMVPQAAPADEHARQAVIDLAGVDDAKPFEQRELAPHVRLPEGRPILATEDGKPRVSLFPVVQWIRDVPGLGDGLFFLEGCEPESELYRSYPSLVEFRNPRPQSVIEAELAARVAAVKRTKIAKAVAIGTLLLVLLGGGTWRYLTVHAARKAEAARHEATRKAVDQERTAETAYLNRASQALNKVREALQLRAVAVEAETGRLHHSSLRQNEILKLSEILIHQDSPAGRNDLLAARLANHSITWRSYPVVSAGCTAVSPDGQFLALGTADGGIAWRATATGSLSRQIAANGLHCSELALANTAVVALSEDHSLWSLSSDGKELIRLDQPAAEHVALAPDGKLLAFSSNDTLHLHRLEGKKDPPALQGHKGAILDLAFSADGKWLATAGADGTVRLWDPNRGRQEKVYGELETVQFVSVAFSQSGKSIAAASSDNTIRVWETSSGKQLYSQKLAAPVSRVAFLADGTTLLVAQENEVSFLDTDQDETVAHLDGHGAPVRGLKLSQDGRFLATSDEKTVRLWDLQPSTEPMTLKGVSPDSASFSPDGTTIATASGDVRLWDRSTGQARKLSSSLPADQQTFRAVAFAPDGQSVAAINTSCLAVIWDVVTGQERHRIQRGNSCPTPVLTYAPDGTTVLLSAGNGKATVFDLERGTELWSKTEAKDVTLAAFSPESATLVTAQGDLAVWAAATGKGFRRLVPPFAVSAMALASDGQTLAVSGARVIDTDLLARRADIPFEAVADSIDHLAFSPRGDSLFGGGSQGIWWWDVASHTLRGHLPGTTAPVKCLAVSPDGQTLLVNDRLISLGGIFGTEAMVLSAHESPVQAVAVSLDGKLIASADGDGIIRLFDSATGEEKARLRGTSVPVLSLAFAPDGQTLAAGSADKTVRLWNLKTRKQVLSIDASGPVSGLAFLAEGEQLVGATGWGLTFWAVATGERLKSLLAHTGSISSFASALSTHRLASASVDGTVKLWDSRTGNQDIEISTQLGVVRTVAYSWDGQVLALGRDDGQLSLRNHDSPGSWFPSQTAAILGLAFSPDGRFLASVSADKTIKLWKLAVRDGSLEARELFLLNGHTQPVTSIAFSPDGSLFVTGSEDGSTRLWNLPALISFFSASPKELLAEAQAQASPY